ncbi:Structure-specific endonuclease subunit SLX4 [Emericellopsis cladophorae]|uniref:Structure-specific endonuclease subunit SLX4 n=1 Tax=Emericellopsis cladophorae TaxID=2686198 RepID=A0A9P9Y2U9_9HYPO|nr:Structure-specific endonuclease subunit SLX4 [Emericellopsis cladophorae]KAI6782341.1 Structure-specific endonuclease subunit SLX4 [Emericellopsis cladophorae]
MTSPDVFLSSPLRTPSRREASSPDDLPPLRELVSQASSRPPIKSGSKAAPIPEGVVTSFTSARDHWKAAIASGRNEDPDASVIEIEQPPPGPSEKKPRKLRAKTEARPKKAITTKVKKVAPESVANARPSVSTGSPSREEPWRKYAASPPAKTTAREGAKDDASGAAADTSLAALEDVLAHDPIVDSLVVAKAEPAKSRAKRSRKQTGTMSGHFQSKETSPAGPPKVEAKREDFPPIERAAERRLDWTPPKPQADIVEGPPDVSTVQEVRSSAVGVNRADFNTMVRNYGCGKEMGKNIITVSEEDSSFMKKRKLVELVQTKNNSRQEKSPSREKSPAKQKAPKKKARTITDLATAAYRQPDPAAQESPSATMMDLLDNPDGTVKRGAAGDAKGNGKQRKKPAKAPKKKAELPRRLLLSPETALKEVTKQDFLFGTSSQLAREQSPSTLRDIQQAIKDSTQLELDNMSDPFKSDPIESFERPKLWRSGHRDADGQLFDSLLVDMADDSTLALREPADDDDPFGYVQADKGLSESGIPPPMPGILGKPSVALEPSPGKVEGRQPSDTALDDGTDVPITTERTGSVSQKQPMEIISDDASFSSSQLSISSDMQRRKEAKATTAQVSSIEPSLPQLHSSTEQRLSVPQQVRPRFERYSDVRLAQTVKSYGFKPLDKRPDMIALLDQCWKSQASTILSGSQCFSTSRQVGEPLASRGASRGATSPARPRGRPRKASVSASESQEPPPSAQAVESPKRPRGRPKKDASSPAKAALSKPRKSPQRVTRAPRAAAKTTSPARKKQPAKQVFEIPDSESDDEENLTSSSSSQSPSPSLSPAQADSPPLDIDVSAATVDGEGDVSLAIAPDDSEEALFRRITRAVMSAPRSTNPDHPSWYEKILLYDPIIIEDLTLWLNTGQLDKVGHDGEVSPAEVKKWCESRSICCLWKVNLRGKERKRL